LRVRGHDGRRGAAGLDPGRRGGGSDEPTAPQIGAGRQLLASQISVLRKYRWPSGGSGMAGRIGSVQKAQDGLTYGFVIYLSGNQDGAHPAQLPRSEQKTDQSSFCSTTLTMVPFVSLTSATG
jgi:hypothetical protein